MNQRKLKHAPQLNFNVRPSIGWPDNSKSSVNTLDKFARIAALRPRIARTRPFRASRKQPFKATASRSFSAHESTATTMANIFPSAVVCHSGDLLARHDARFRLLLPPAAGSTAGIAQIGRLPSIREQWLFLDTETTGLAGGTGTYAFMVGIAWWDAGGLQVEQFFMRDLDEEHSLLLELSERMKQRPVLVTFNGKSFDWPLLETRYPHDAIVSRFQPKLHLDLLHPARQLWRLRIGSVRLRDLERQVLGGRRPFARLVAP